MVSPPRMRQGGALYNSTKKEVLILFPFKFLPPALTSSLRRIYSLLASNLLCPQSPVTTPSLFQATPSPSSQPICTSPSKAKKVSLTDVGVLGGLSDGLGEREKGPLASCYTGRAMGAGSGFIIPSTINYKNASKGSTLSSIEPYDRVLHLLFFNIELEEGGGPNR
ncbi:uncharacterized protein LOC122278635 [Carya illinoinensis]|uniref:uncharacterized protein LOC122278635 n=1 Tax=Carya illinoinensis TaxID=32201 RepID=UPI001C725F01|nr:uncharacterized protein LOC122278635 [Carya illinoinensis]